mmetsp:Transcript_20949/g.48664  ORF Transcript_20949/g.48664 Transcript_20949/m.48664 type:complete len:240 (-) Transcript_20949:1105-1824(-)
MDAVVPTPQGATADGKTLGSALRDVPLPGSVEVVWEDSVDHVITCRSGQCDDERLDWEPRAKRTWHRTFLPPALAVHGLALLLLLLADALFVHQAIPSSRWPSHTAFGLSLIVLYALGLGAAACCARPRRFRVMALLHTTGAFMSAWWRESVQPRHEGIGARVASVAGAMQLITALLHAPDVVGLCGAFVCSMVVLVAVDVQGGNSAAFVLDNALTLAAMGLTAVLAASARTGAFREAV